MTEHPAITAFRNRPPAPAPAGPLNATTLRQICLDAGADDAGFVEIGRPELASQRDSILRLLPGAKSLISIVRRMNRGNIRSPARSIANVEFHHAAEDTNEIALRIVSHCERAGFRAVIGAPVGFPMEASHWPAQMWTLSHKPIAVAAGLGRMGIHRNVIHPRFGNFILLGTVILDREIGSYSAPVEFNPCLECKLCVATCPTGAISPNGDFNFSACYTHNYREFMGGFGDWVETIAGSRSAAGYRQRVSDAETVSMWQSLSFGANYKAAYCLSVCPAGEEVIAPYLTDRKQFLDEVVRPLQEKAETVYVVANSDAEAYVSRRFPQKRIKRVGNGLRPATIDGFLAGLPLTFQRNQAKGLNAAYHFTFTGAEPRTATVTIRDQRLTVSAGHEGTADFHLTADSRVWLRFVRKETGIIGALLRRKLRFKGRPQLLLAFGRCFS
jgi:NAD-dependent dihydropyrimidine dehydrogenase PreA subunit